jgi:predicted nucleotide-binding protein (sugar kinase/HSP70/actin superfamily)
VRGERFKGRSRFRGKVPGGRVEGEERREEGSMGREEMDAGVEREIEEELRRFEAEERARLGLAEEAGPQWRDEVHSRFTADQRARTTLLVSGLTMAHDLFVQAALRGLGYQVRALDCPDNAALQVGKEYGNRGQCNPTYFTVGNLVKFLIGLREEGHSREEIVDHYVFVTAGACGPCRFGTYVTEYRKALRDAGFDGFRVLLFQQQGGLKQATGAEMGLQMNPRFFVGLLKAIVTGDVLNALGYRIRPYEVEAGATDRALEASKARIAAALEGRGSLALALWETRRALGAVAVDRTRVRPKVAIIGEFWAMTTEGDGNYRLQRFLEKEGAEVDIQLVTAWLLYNIWQVRHDTALRAGLRGADGGKKGLANVDVAKRLALLALGESVLRGFFRLVANAMGLHGYVLTDMEEMAAVSHAFYDVNLRGGEGHMEVGKLILNVAHAKVNMTLSVKPFGCMPSSAVSDGVQSLITEMFPEGIFLPIETSGDGAVNVQSRVQMQLWKARRHAQTEVDRALAETGLTLEEVRARLARDGRRGRALRRPPHVAGCTAADTIYDVAEGSRPVLVRLRERALGVASEAAARARTIIGLGAAASGAAHGAGGGAGRAHARKLTAEDIAEVARRAARRTAEAAEARRRAEAAAPPPAREGPREAPVPERTLRKLPMAR